MKRNMIFLITAFSLSWINNVSGQSEIKLSGFIDTAITKQFASNELTICINETSNNFSQGSLFKIPIARNGTFNTKLATKSSLVYLSFEFENKRDNWKGKFFNASFPKPRPLKETYLFQKGDSINVNIGKNGLLSFTGKGSEKLKCEWQIYNIEPLSESFNSRTSDLSNNGKLKKLLFLNDKAVNLAIQLRLAILESYKATLTTEIYNLLYTDAIATAQFQILSKLPNYYIRFQKSENKAVIEQYYQFLSRKNDFPIPDSTNMAESVYYADMLFEKEYNYLRFFDKKTPHDSGNSFKEIYERIKTNYNGKLKDKLTLICFERLIGRQSEEARLFINDAIKTGSNKDYVRSLINLKEKQFKAFPFELYDVNGKIHKLNDYLGKLVVIETWFTGCGNCLTLSRAMHPIIQEYKDNEDIVFITVCTDNKTVWLKSLASNKYTSASTINLFTNGMGYKNPFFQNYNIIGAPRQFIIGKNGELVTSSPPRVDTGLSNYNAFIKILQDNLESNKNN